MSTVSDKHKRRIDYKGNILCLALGDGLSRFGGQFNYFAVAALTYGITKSAFMTALQMAVHSLAMVVWAPRAGRVADRMDPRIALAVSSLVRSIVALAYIWVRDPYAIMILGFVGTSVGTFGGPARTALVPRLAGRQRILEANGLKSSIGSAFELLGPGLAGAIMVSVGTTWAFVIDSISFLFPCLAMVLVKPLPKEEWSGGGDANESEASGPTGPETHTIKGLAAADAPFALIIAAHTAFTLGMWGVNSIFFPFVTDYLHRGPEVMGWMISAYYGAGLLSGAVVGRWGRGIMGSRWHLAAYALGGIPWILYTINPTVTSITILSFLDGIVFTLVNILFDTMLQERVPSHRLGRIAGRFMRMMETASMLGMLGAGAVATLGNLPAAYLSCAACVMAVPVMAPVLFRVGRARATLTPLPSHE